jgi:hypothetical protein
MKTAVEYLEQELERLGVHLFDEVQDVIEKAKEMESKQLFLASNTSAKDAYKAGQKTMQCGCYEISDALTYEEWLYETFKSE